MRRMFAMLRVSVIQVLRDRGELVSIVVLPLLLTYVFGVAFGSQGAERPVLVMWLDGDTSRYAQQIENLVAEDPSIDVERSTPELAEEKLDKGEAALIVRIPGGFGTALETGRKGTVEVTQDPSSQRATGAREVVQGAAARVGAGAQAATVAAGVLRDLAEVQLARRRGGPPGMEATPTPAAVPPSFATAYDIADGFWEPDPPIGVAGVQVTSSEVRGDSVLATSNIQYSVGFTLMFVLFMAFGSAGGILEEREQGTLRRLLVTPSSRAQILGGKILGVIGTSTIEALILVGLGAVAFSVPWGRDPLALILVLSAYILASAGLAVFVTAVVRTRSQLSAIGPIASTALAMLGGCYWPIEITPPFMQTIAKFTPTGWGMIGLLDVVARGQGLEAAWLPAAVLGGIAVVAFSAGVAVLKMD
ncbi:MAG: ABC transporter permease [Actinomycetota bacterium]|nr:ABC transporter permease [Actinomycetota bacterium]